MGTPKVGFIGLGHMGAPMASCLVERGFDTIVFDAAGTEERAPAGAKAASDLRDMTEAEVILMSLPHGEASVSVCRELTESMTKHIRYVVDLSSIGVPAAEKCAKILNHSNMKYIDSPVSGGQRGAASGSLTLMTAAEQQDLDFVRPVLSAFSTNIFHMGDQSGQGQAMKLLNNYLASSILAATSEAAAAGVHAGLDLKQMIEIINVSTGSSFMSNNVFMESVIPEKFDAGFSSSLLLKDLKLYGDSIEQETPADLFRVVLSLWEEFEETQPNTDVSQMYKYLLNKRVPAK
ncbi:NAD(P)-dependent oxidoreductase [Salibacterium aidingense]|uniref:NAD(P)-dependent oxidoreductase n=1 Tax=Salibacterium aidingense TaxID=384933 RepID=UPI003BBD9718